MYSDRHYNDMDSMRRRQPPPAIPRRAPETRLSTSSDSAHSQEQQDDFDYQCRDYDEGPDSGHITPDLNDLEIHGDPFNTLQQNYAKQSVHPHYNRSHSLGSGSLNNGYHVHHRGSTGSAGSVTGYTPPGTLRQQHSHEETFQRQLPLRMSSQQPYYSQQQETYGSHLPNGYGSTGSDQEIYNTVLPAPVYPNSQQQQQMNSQMNSQMNHHQGHHSNHHQQQQQQSHISQGHMNHQGHVNHQVQGQMNHNHVQGHMAHNQGQGHMTHNQGQGHMAHNNHMTNHHMTNAAAAPTTHNSHNRILQQQQLHQNNPSPPPPPPPLQGGYEADFPPPPPPLFADPLGSPKAPATMPKPQAKKSMSPCNTLTKNNASGLTTERGFEIDPELAAKLNNVRINIAVKEKSMEDGDTSSIVSSNPDNQSDFEGYPDDGERPKQPPPPVKPKPDNMPTGSGDAGCSLDFPVDPRTLEGYVEIPENCPAWKKAMLEKRNKQVEDEAKRQWLEVKAEEERWKGVPEWKKKIILEKQKKKSDEEETIQARTSDK